MGLGAVAALVQGAELVHGHDILGTGGHQHLDDGSTGSAGAVQDDVHVLHLFAHHAQGVDEGSGHHDGGAVLVIVEHGDIQLSLQRLFDLKALGALDILQIDAAKGGGNGLAGCDHTGGIVGIDADGEGIHAAELLEQHGLALHHRQTGLGADVTQAQHGGAVGDNGHHVALEGVLINIVGVFLDLAAGLGNAGGVGGRQVIAGLDLHLAGNAHLAVVGLVHFKGGFVVIHGVFLRLYRALPTEGSGRGFSYLFYFNRTGRAFPPEKPLFRPVPRKSRTNPALYLWNFCKILFFFTFALYNKVCTMRPESEPGGMPVFQQEELYFEKDHHKGGLPALRRCAGAGRSRLLQVR